MTHIERVAIARIISDIVRADFIIESSETKMIHDTFGEKSHYRLNYDILRESREIRFSDALNNLSELPFEEKKMLFENLLTLAKVDGVCDPREILLLVAVRFSFGLESEEGCTTPCSHCMVFSCPTHGIQFTNHYMIYLESKYHVGYNQEISENLKLFSLTLNHWGIDFIYLPGMVAEFEKMDATYVKSVLRFISPELTEERAEDVYSRLHNLTTTSFCNHVLANNLKVEEVRNIQPSILINIGTSAVPYYSTDGEVEYYTEFLSLPLANSVSEIVESFTEMYGNMVTGYSIQGQSIRNMNGKRFKYFGFYKSILDFLVKAEPKEGIIVFCKRTSSIYIPVLHKEVELSPQECSIYTLIAMRSSIGECLPTCFSEKKEMLEMNHQYAKLYSYKGGTSKELPSNIAPIVSRINKKIKTALKSLDNIQAFLVTNSKKGYYISADDSLIMVSDTPSNSLNGIKLTKISTILQ